MNMKGYEPYQANSDPFKCISGYNDDVSKYFNPSLYSLITLLFQIKVISYYSLFNTKS